MRTSLSRLVAPVVLVFTPTSLAAQVFLYAAGGATFPTSDYGDYAETGWIAAGGFGVPLGETGFAMGAEGFYGQNNHSDLDGDKTNPYGLIGWLGFRLGPPERIAPFIGAGAGVLVHKYGSDTFPEDSESQFAYVGAAGVDIPLGSMSVMLQGRYFGSEDTRFFGLLAGVSFSVGQQ